jgi:cardiolipin synthase
MVIARDVLIMLGVLVLFLDSLAFSIRPSILSKANTIFQFVTVLLVLSKGYMSISPEFYLYVYYATALLTISSGLHYIYAWFKMIGDEIENHDNNS